MGLNRYWHTTKVAGQQPNLNPVNLLDALDIFTLRKAFLAWSTFQPPTVKIQTLEVQLEVQGTDPKVKGAHGEIKRRLATKRKAAQVLTDLLRDGLKMLR